MSLTARVSAFFLAALALVLIGFSLALYLTAERYLAHELEDHLDSTMATLIAGVEVDEDDVEWDPAEHPLNIGYDPSPEQCRWIVFDGHGQPVDRSVNFASLGFATDWIKAAAAQPSGLRVHNDWKQAWRVLAAVKPKTDPLGPGEYHQLVLVAGVSRAPMWSTLNALLLTLTLTSLAIWLTAALCGRSLGRHALRPLTDMVQAARSITAAELSRRLPEPGTRDELDDLARVCNELLGRLEDAFTSQRRFTGDASHQLRTPLTALLGQIEVARRKPRSGEEYRELLDGLHEEAGRLRQIVEGLLFLARADADAIAPELETLDLSNWLPGYFAKWAAQSRGGDLQLHVEPACRVRAHPPLIAQLLDNLLENACKYSPPGSSITLSSIRQGHIVELTVGDEGWGMSPDEAARVFDPFYRSARARNSGCGGVGLGLPIAQRIAALSGGMITLTSQPGSGSHFCIKLPAVVGTVTQTPADSPTPTAR
ncbi:MAG: ATP-binding protein [Gemmataceae bacterium]